MYWLSESNMRENTVDFSQLYVKWTIIKILWFVLLKLYLIQEKLNIRYTCQKFVFPIIYNTLNWHHNKWLIRVIVNDEMLYPVSNPIRRLWGFRKLESLVLAICNHSSFFFNKNVLDNILWAYVYVLVAQLCPTLCKPTDL